MTPELVFRDPYFLDFLGLKDRYLEKDLEDAILREIEQFLLELGSGFAFVARQKRIQLDNDDYYIELNFHPENFWSGNCTRQLKRPGQESQIYRKNLARRLENDRQRTIVDTGPSFSFS
ncbi:MAG: PDDEXK nuclease domain-containing protein [Victivallales bacterium]